MDRTRYGRHGRPPAFMPDSRVLAWLNSGSRLAVASSLSLLAVLASLAMAGVLAVMQGPVLFQPTLNAEVANISPTGREIGCGKGCRCDEALILMAVQDGGPGNEFDCVDYYAVGAEVELRRHRDNPAEVYVDPIPGVWLPVAGAGFLALIGAFFVFAAGVGLAWEALKDTLRWRSSRHRPRKPLSPS